MVLQRVGERRAALGGSWRQPSYKYRDFDAGEPFDRLPDYGFRCAKYRDPAPAAVFEPIARPERDGNKETPADDATFRAWTNAYAYDPLPLNARLEESDDTAEHYRAERVSFRAAYGDERVSAWLFLPKGAVAPFQTVVFYPPSGANFDTSSRPWGDDQTVQFVMRSGRALLLPVYKGTFERIEPLPKGPNAARRQAVERAQDMRRAIDWLQTRKDIDTAKVAFYGISMGCREGTAPVALEPRLRTAVLAYCGIPIVRQADGTDPLDFAPRIKIPVLLLEARDDFTYPYMTSQLPFFRLLGAPEKDKKMVLRDGGHIATFPPEILRVILDWLDRYLGPVR
jgi:dienelactone hydrolase